MDMPACDTRAMLVALGYIDAAGHVVGKPDVIDWRIRLLSVLERCQQFFDFSDTPMTVDQGHEGAFLMGVVMAPSDFGLTTQETAPISAGGRGLSAQAALEGCLCEAAERLSLYDYAPGGPAFVGHDLSSHSAVNFARDKVLKPLQTTATRFPAVSSAGCGSGPHFDIAVASGLLELVERDAVALWWHGGRQGGSADDLAHLLAAPFGPSAANGINRWRWFLDITTDIGVPVIAAVSAKADGKGVVVAAAAAWDRKTAAHKAALELAQMEFSATLAEVKSRSRRPSTGEMAPHDQIWLSRLTSHDAKAHKIFHPHSGKSEMPDGTLTQKELLKRLGRDGKGVSVIDLTLPSIGIPCARVIAPRLQAMGRGAETTERLAKARSTPGAVFPPSDWPTPI
ncbi:MAG: YcaO-like family protein [Pikeienuella sp.]